MTLYRSLSMNQLISYLDIFLPGKRPFVVPSSVAQALQRLGGDAVRLIFNKICQLWFDKTLLSHGDGLSLLAVDDGLLIRRKIVP
jgi:hypothetical protein